MNDTDTTAVVDDAGQEAASAGWSEQDREVAEQLVAKARDEGLDLISLGGVLIDLTKRVLEAALQAEMTDHLGYDRHHPDGRDGRNSRNGTRSKTVITQIGPVSIDVPRDRDGSFEPRIVKKRQRRLGGVDEIVIPLTAKGLTTGEVQTHLAEVYGTQVSRETISEINDRVLEEMTATARSPPGRPTPRSVSPPRAPATSSGSGSVAVVRARSSGCRC